jgi:oligopeptide/dipeptide ABC transporter ATP-binding protein
MTAPIIVARGATVHYPGAAAPALAPCDVTIEEGCSIGVVGESGSGKTTLARALVGLVAPSAGSVEVGGRPWTSVRRNDPLRRSVQMIFQDPYASLNPRLTPRQTVGEVLQVWEGMSRAEAHERAGELLAEVGLPADAFDRRPSRLSGGQCQRVGIARALACSPRVLVADEPTSSLDVSVQAQVLNLILELRAAHGLALVLISHDLGVIRYVAERSLVMYRGQVVEEGPTDRLFEEPSHPYTRVLIDSIPGRDGPANLVRNDVDPAHGCVFAPRCERIGAGCAHRQPPLEIRGARAAACYYPLGELALVAASDHATKGAP